MAFRQPRRLKSITINAPTTAMVGQSINLTSVAFDQFGFNANAPVNGVALFVSSLKWTVTGPATIGANGSLTITGTGPVVVSGSPSGQSDIVGSALVQGLAPGQG